MAKNDSIVFVCIKPTIPHVLVDTDISGMFLCHFRGYCVNNRGHSTIGNRQPANHPPITHQRFYTASVKSGNLLTSRLNDPGTPEMKLRCIPHNFDVHKLSCAHRDDLDGTKTIDIMRVAIGT
jgi:hypothetical protein